MNTRALSPVGMGNMAAEFAKTAAIVAENDESHQFGIPDNFFAFLYLAAHALELAYKSVLLAHGKSESYLKKKLRHDLMKCRDAAHRFEDVSTMEHAAISHIIHLISDCYRRKAFEYHTPGAYPPLPGNLRAVAEATSETVAKIGARVRALERARRAT